LYGEKPNPSQTELKMLTEQEKARAMSEMEDFLKNIYYAGKNAIEYHKMGEHQNSALACDFVYKRAIQFLDMLGFSNPSMCEKERLIERIKELSAQNAEFRKKLGLEEERLTALFSDTEDDEGILSSSARYTKNVVGGYKVVSITDIESALEWNYLLGCDEWDWDPWKSKHIHKRIWKTMTWHDAIKYAQSMSEDEWRLPRVDELATLIFEVSMFGYSFAPRGCRKDTPIKIPTIHPIFPYHPPIQVWAENESCFEPDKAWVVNFGNGQRELIDKNTRCAVRLVRNG
jgi:hypothetical protein